MLLRFLASSGRSVVCLIFCKYNLFLMLDVGFSNRRKMHVGGDIFRVCSAFISIGFSQPHPCRYFQGFSQLFVRLQLHLTRLHL